VPRRNKNTFANGSAAGLSNKPLEQRSYAGRSAPPFDAQADSQALLSTEVDAMPEPVVTPAAALMRLTNGYQVSQAIHVAAELRLADFIGDGPVTADEIAPRVGAHARSLYRLLRALSTVGIFRETDDKRFVGSSMSNLLRTEHPGSMWGYRDAAVTAGRRYAGACPTA
jgi:methyltransferase family protein